MNELEVTKNTQSQDPTVITALVPPEAVHVVLPEEAEKKVEIPPDVATKIDTIVDDFVSQLVVMDIHTDVYKRQVDDIGNLANREMRTTSEVSNRLLDRPARALSGLSEGKSPIAKSLLDLRRSVEELNPAKYNLKTSGSRKLLGVIPFGDSIKAYFAKYEKSQSHIQGIVGALNDGKGELEKDNAAIGQEQKALWSQTEMLREYAYMAAQLDHKIEAAIMDVEATDAQRGKTLREDVLFPIRRRRQELLTQLAVAIQGYAALRVVEVNNKELIHAVQTATTTTIAALRTSVMVAQALTTQKMVSEQVAAVNDVTSSMIESTSEMLLDQTNTVETQATRSGVNVESLQHAWTNVFQALDQIDTYKLRALESMKITVSELSGQVEQSRVQIERLHGKEEPRAQLNTGGPPLLRLPERRP